MKLNFPIVLALLLAALPGVGLPATAQDVPSAPDAAAGQQELPATNPAVQDPANATPAGQTEAPATEGSSSATAQAAEQPEWPQDQEGWFLVTPPGSQATVAMPVTPRPSERQMVPVEGVPIHVRMMAAVDGQNVNYVFAWHDQKAPDGLADIRNTLDGAVKGALGSTLGQLESAEPLLLNGNPGCDFRIRFAYKDQPMRVAGRVILVGPRVYQLTCVVPDGVEAEALITKFAGSFVHVPEPASPLETGAPPASLTQPSDVSGGQGN